MKRNGPRGNRAVLAAKASELRGQGLLFREIADRLGVSVSYAEALVKDPDGSKDRARKRRYGGVCRECGATTDGSRGRALAPKLCAHCAPAVNRAWGRDAIIDAIQRWNLLFGQPPTASDWHPQVARANGRPDLARVFETMRGDWPHTGTVQRTFGSWNAGIAAAGFMPRKAGVRGPDRPRVVIGNHTP